MKVIDYPMCTWHCCQKARAEGGALCEDHARLVELETENADLTRQVSTLKRQADGCWVDHGYEEPTPAPLPAEGMDKLMDEEA